VYLGSVNVNGKMARSGVVDEFEQVAANRFEFHYFYFIFWTGRGKAKRCLICQAKGILFWVGYCCV
jgi:hypothetical protein